MAKTKVHGEYLDPSVISGQTQVTAVGADSVLIFDATDNALKKALVSDLGESNRLPLAGGTMTGNIVMSDDTSIGIADDAERIEFDGAGDISLLGANVGIGTASPDTLLNLKDTGSIEVRLEADSNNNGQEDCFIRFYTDGKTQEGIAGMDNNNSSTLFSGNTENAMVFGTVSNLPVVFATNNTERMQIANDGKVGIGTDNPLVDLDITKSQSAATKLLVRNTSSNDNADAAVSFLTQGNVDFTIGIDQSAGSHFKISKHETLGNNDALTINTSGYVNKPLQPMFGVARNAGYMTDDQVWIADFADTNVGSHYSTSNGKFTAPVAGVYFFTGSVMTHDSGSSATQVSWSFRKNNSDVKEFRQHKTGGYHTRVDGSMIITLAANDYVTLFVDDSGTSSGWAGSQHIHNHFGGFLIG